MHRKGKRSEQQPPSESWEDFHKQYHSHKFHNSAANPSVLKRIGKVPSTFAQRESSRNLVDQFLMSREDSMSSLGGSSRSGSERSHRSATRKDGSHISLPVMGRRRNQGNIKIGKTPEQSKRWSLPFFSGK